MELTKEYFDQQIKNLVTKDYLKTYLDGRLANLVTKDYLDERLANFATKQDLENLRDELINHTSNAIAELAEHINETVAIPLTRHLQQNNHWPIKR